MDAKEFSALNGKYYPCCMKKFVTYALLAFALALNAQAKNKDKDKYNGLVLSVSDNDSFS